jgi:hypothetical protein
MAPVSGQAVPYENDLLTAQSWVKVLQKGHQAFCVVAPRTRPKEQTRALPIPAIAEGRAHRDLGLVEGVDENRRFAFGGPGSSHRGGLGDTAFILKVDPGLLAPSVFFTAGHRWVSHNSTFCGLRSRA